MSNFLRFLVLLTFVCCLLTFLRATNLISDHVIPLSHISLAIPTFLILLFVQAFVMFFLIGVNKLAKNIHEIVCNNSPEISELFIENPPSDLTPYVQSMGRYFQQTNLIKRQTIPWTMLIITLGMLGFLLGGAHDTGLVDKNIHVGVIYGLMLAVVIGSYRQWILLGRANSALREIKTLFSIPDSQM